MSRSAGRPTVRVPVLSKSRISASASRSSAPPPLTTTPRRAVRDSPATIATGAARISGHGVATTSTATARPSSPDTAHAAPATPTLTHEEGEGVAVREPHERRVVRRCCLDQPHDAGVGRVVGSRAGQQVERTASVHGTAPHGLADRSLDRQRLAGDRAVVDDRDACMNGAVHRDHLARLHEQQVTDGHLIQRRIRELGPDVSVSDLRRTTQQHVQIPFSPTRRPRLEAAPSRQHHRDHGAREVLAHHECAEQREQGDGIDAKSSMTAASSTHHADNARPKTEVTVQIESAAPCAPKSASAAPTTRPSAATPRMTVSARRINERAIDVLLPNGSALDRSRWRAGADRPPNVLRVPQHSCERAAADSSVSALNAERCRRLGRPFQRHAESEGSRRTGVGLAGRRMTATTGGRRPASIPVGRRDVVPGRLGARVPDLGDGPRRPDAGDHGSDDQSDRRRRGRGSSPAGIGTGRPRRRHRRRRRLRWPTAGPARRARCAAPRGRSR